MSARMEVLVDGEWTQVNHVQEMRFSTTNVEPDPITETTRASWTLEGRIAGEPQEFWEAIQRAEREAFAARCRARMWLAYPYRVRGAH